MAVVEGKVDLRFARVRDVLAENVASGIELGGAVSVVLDGRTVVDIWGGYRDAARTTQWTENTLVNVYSATKGITAIAALQLVDQGKLDLDARASAYWPEFAAEGKGDIPVRWLFSHTAGVPGVREPLTLEELYDPDIYSARIAAERPFWVPGTKHGYHATSIGALLGTLIERIDGRSAGRYVAEELSGPLGMDFHIGTGPEHDHRIADMQMPPPPGPGDRDMLGEILKNPGSPGYQALLNPLVVRPDVVNSRGWRAAEIPAGNGHGTARDLARIYGALALDGELDGRRVLSREVIAQANTEQACGPDACLVGQSTRFGLGFMLTQSDLRGASFGPGKHAFGHPGAGGSLGFADPDAGIGFGYVMNQMRSGFITGLRAQELIEACYSCL